MKASTLKNSIGWWRLLIFLTAMYPLGAFAQPAVICDPGLTKASVKTAAISFETEARTELVQILETLLKTPTPDSTLSTRMAELVKQTRRQHLYTLDAPESLLSLIKVPERPDQQQSFDPQHFKRYGQEDRPIFAYKLAGTPGAAGGVYIYTPGESCGELDFGHFLGPPHRHIGADHISIVTRGQGLFYIEVPTTNGTKLLPIPVHRGSTVFIPSNSIHTFYAGNSGPFDVASFTTSLIPTDSPAFQQMISETELKPLLPPVRPPRLSTSTDAR